MDVVKNKKRIIVICILCLILAISAFAVRFISKNIRHSSDKELQESLTQLQSIGYLGGYQKADESKPAPKIQTDAEKLAPGFTLITTGHAPAAYLLNSDRKIMHQWSYEFAKIFPDYKISARHKNRDLPGYWRHATLLPNGDLLAIFEGLALIKLDKDSNLIWAKQNHAHHDLDLLPNGDIVVLTRTAEIRDEKPVLADYISYRKAEDGKRYNKISLIDAIVTYPERAKIIGDLTIARDFLHTNSVQVLDANEASLIPGVQADDVLVSMRNINTLGIIRPSTGQFVWTFKDAFKMQHSAEISFAKKELLLFDNSGGKGGSRVLRYDLPSLKLKSQITSKNLNAHFFSRSLGSVQDLPNGNILIADSEGGRVYEVDSDGKLLWRFTTPYRTGEGNKLIATIPMATREAPEMMSAWLK